MSIERLIVRRLLESREQVLSNYKGFQISMDYDNYVIVRNRRGERIGEFEDTDSARDYIDDMSSREKSSHSKPLKVSERIYLIYEKGTYKSNRAKYLKRNPRVCRYCNEADADKFTEEEMRSITRKNPSKYDFYKV